MFPSVSFLYAIYSLALAEVSGVMLRFPLMIAVINCGVTPRELANCFRFNPDSSKILMNSDCERIFCFCGSAGISRFCSINFKILIATEKKDKEAWNHVVSEVFSIPFPEAYGNLLHGKESVFNVIGLENEAPVATGTLIIENQKANIYNISTLEERESLNLSCVI